MHNLKNVHVKIPCKQITVVTGVSGSGKSSLTMDTLFAEGQRRYIESLSAYARQFIKTMQKPDVDTIDGLCPAVAIHQKVIARTARSTVGSITEIADYLRLLFAKIGKTYSPISNTIVKKEEVSDVVNYIASLPNDTKVIILIPLPKELQKNKKYYLEDLMHKGYSRLYNISENKIESIEDWCNNNHSELETNNMYLLVDRLVKKEYETDEWHRIADSIQTAFDETKGDVYLYVNQNEFVHFCNRFEADGMRFEIPTPNFFSNNNPYGACSKCEGLGHVLGISESLVIPNKSLSLYEGAVACWQGEKMSQWKKNFISNSFDTFPIHEPISKLSAEQYNYLWKSEYGIDAFFNMVQENFYKIQYRVLYARYRGKAICPECNGNKIRKDALYVKIADTHIGTLLQMPIEKLDKWIDNLELDKYELSIAQRILKEIKIRLQTLIDVGLPYLTADRAAATLSGGESQRIQLTKILGSNLSDSLYVLDEPSIGLHARDTDRLITVLKKLRDLGNTLVIVEHDEQIMKQSDHIIDMGPLASHLGGEVVAEGDYKKIIKDKKSLTGQYLSGKLKINIDKPQRRVVNKIVLNNCYLHNLKNITVEIPLQMLTVVCGVSGSGKTTLIKHILYPALNNKLNSLTSELQGLECIKGDYKTLQSVEMVDQNPIGKSSRSNPVSYIGAYDDIRNLFAATKLAKMRGYTPGFFSYNVDGGRCDHCKGDGSITVSMQFLADVQLPCEICNGKRFKEELLEIKYNDKSIADVLSMSLDESVIFFKENNKLYQKLLSLQKVGLGYIQLGQSSDTLSGGEAQRVKLASFMDKSFMGKNILFIFDEPTTGLHFNDIVKLLQSLNTLIENGHSVIIIEHNHAVIENADWIIDMGPEGGEKGGNIVFEGTVSDFKKCNNSYTAKYLNQQ